MEYKKKYQNINNTLYKFIKKRNKCDVIIKLTITKRTVSGKTSGWNSKKSTKRETKLERERERERERVLTSFVMDNLEGKEERGGNEIIRNLWKKLRWKKNSGSGWKVEQSTNVKFKKI